MSLILPQRGRIRQAAAAGAFDPNSLFSGGEDGFIIDPQTVGNLWQNDDFTTVISATGQEVKSITDASDAARNIKIVSGATGPTYEYDSGNDTHYLNFASSDQLETPVGVGLAPDDWSCYVGWYMPTGSTTNQPIIDGDGNGGGLIRVAQYNWIYASKARVVQFNSGSAASSTGSLSVDTAYVLKTKADETAATITAGLDGTWGTDTTSLTTPFPSPSQSIYIGKYRGPVSSYATGRLYYALFINRLLNSGEDADLDTYIGNLIGKSI